VVGVGEPAQRAERGVVFGAGIGVRVVAGAKQTQRGFEIGCLACIVGDQPSGGGGPA
jgi:hypothetical protein